MFDKFIQTLSFAADPPEGGGGTKTGIGGAGISAPSTTDETAQVDPPESDGGGGTETSSTSASSTSTE